MFVVGDRGPGTPRLRRVEQTEFARRASRCAPWRAGNVVERARQTTFFQMRPWLRNNPHVQRAVNRQDTVALAAERCWMLRLKTTPEILCRVIRRLTFDACHAECNPAKFVVAAKAAAISPSRVLMVVVGPRDRPVVAARCLAAMGGPNRIPLARSFRSMGMARRQPGPARLRPTFWPRDA